MTTLNAELYDALRAINVPDDKARAAASALDGYDSRFTKIEADMTTLKWMVGVNLTVSLLVLAAMLTFLLRYLPALPLIK
jgi:hypothetical protein